MTLQVESGLNIHLKSGPYKIEHRLVFFCPWGYALGTCQLIYICSFPHSYLQQRDIDWKKEQINPPVKSRAPPLFIIYHLCVSLFFVYLFLCHDHTHMASLEIDLSLIFDLGWTLTLTILTLIVWLERDKSDFFEVLLQKIRIRRGLHHVNRMIARMQLLDYNLKHKKKSSKIKKKISRDLEKI